MRELMHSPGIYPVSLLASDCSNTQTAAVVAKLDSASSNVESGEERTLEERQKDDPSLAVILAYLQKSELPEEEKAARELVLGEPMYTVIIDGVLYHVERDKTLRIIPPTAGMVCHINFYQTVDQPSSPSYS